MKTLRYSTFAFFSITALVMGAITLVDWLTGVPGSSQKVYASQPFVLLWCIMSILALLYILKCKLWRMPATMMIHVSFLVILCGALVTHLFGIQGAVSLNSVRPTDIYFEPTSTNFHKLPFTVMLDRFDTEFYNGTMSPRDYVSHIVINDNGTTIKGIISMNNIFSYHGYRFYQSSYTDDGVRLSISHDPYGIGITYTGYALLLLSMFLFFFQKNSHFRRLLASKNSIVVALFVFVSLSLNAKNETKTAPSNVVNDFCNLHIYYNGRICPLQTYAYQFTTKLCGKDSYHGHNAEEVLTGWLFFPDVWKEEPMIKIKGVVVKEILGTDQSYVSIYDFANDNGDYLLSDALTDIAQGRNVNGKTDILNTDDKVNVINDLFTGESLRVFPVRNNDGTIKWFSPFDSLPCSLDARRTYLIRQLFPEIKKSVIMHHYSRSRQLINQLAEYQRSECGDVLPSGSQFVAEKIYNKISSSRIWAMGCLTLGIILFLYSIHCISRQKFMHRVVTIASVFALLTTLVYLSACLVLRTYISQHMPLSNGYETMQFLAWCCLLLTLVLHRRAMLALPFGFIICGFALLVATIGQSNPAVSNLVPVLQSPLLSIHVMVIMIAYALLAFIMLDGIAALILMRSGNGDFGLHRLSLLMLYPAVFLLSAGIFIGAVWANISWGRYWGWDAKEVWALITLMVYSLPIHGKSLPFMRSARFFHVFSIVSFLTVLMTYFGVNYLLGGLHSYA